MWDTTKKDENIKSRKKETEDQRKCLSGVSLVPIYRDTRIDLNTEKEEKMKPRKKRNRRPKYKERVCQGFLLLQQNNRTWRKCKTKTKKKQKAGSYGKILLSCITLIREVSLNKHFCFLYYFSF